MRNLLITVMLLIVTVLLFTGIVMDDNNGIKKHIMDQGNSVNADLANLSG